MISKDSLYHFVGIKGSGMSALALILDGEGYRVQGSDIEKYFFTQQGLEEAQIPMMPFSADNIQPGLTIIAGNAFTDDHPELVKARELGLTIYRYHDFLGELIQSYTSVAVTGCHGKTSTTGLLAHCLSHLTPTSYLIGDGTGYGNEAAKYFALEACEYRRHFLAYEPDYAIITNVDFDHPDYYHSIEDVFDAFKTFANQTKKGVIAYGEDPYLRQLETAVPIHYYGVDPEDYICAQNIRRNEEGSDFDVLVEGQLFGSFHVPSYGKHNIMNALAVICFLQLEGFQAEEIARYLKAFPGVKRRFSVKQVQDLIVIDDYAHHPSEIRATIDAAKQKYPHRRVVAVFQPHTFSRTIALLKDFAEALSLADEVHLVDIFTSAREKSGQVTIQDLASMINDKVEIISANHLSPLMDYQDEVILFMGAGDIDNLAHQFEKAYGALNLKHL
ncbi:MAG: UDP-N-acetylmuramate--L-alanine ligase [Facklamia hominis]|uniref:UDP-N-acetylmuramate--L-alanine ligase n=1 Tax=Facklamia hominis TaxID=178214 RepID=A0AAJ1Q441_9LACT|nr:UDP-N-acetylmuramate--L-alanine ligase [Facklamia hominis]EPH10198.1 UDP-N-acetylmuramate-alanine ligase [Facklamia hominis ACS-120-V-Sch10]MDK7187297.1 UDP-N-acetylmuramate--L-alanine ligase [Facklamia hominis]